jgi:hypothetical protein
MVLAVFPIAMRAGARNIPEYSVTTGRGDVLFGMHEVSDVLDGQEKVGKCLVWRFHSPPPTNEARGWSGLGREQTESATAFLLRNASVVFPSVR